MAELFLPSFLQFHDTYIFPHTPTFESDLGWLVDLLYAATLFAKEFAGMG
jgi:hypothetical protein